MTHSLSSTVEAFLAHKRALGRKYHSEAAELTLLVRFAEQNGLSDLDQLTPASIVFAFENTHPHPLVRLPIVQATANAWRLTGGATFPFPF